MTVQRGNDDFARRQVVVSSNAVRNLFTNQARSAQDEVPLFLGQHCTSQKRWVRQVSLPALSSILYTAKSAVKQKESPTIRCLSTTRIKFYNSMSRRRRSENKIKRKQTYL